MKGEGTLSRWLHCAKGWWWYKAGGWYKARWYDDGDVADDGDDSDIEKDRYDNKYDFTNLQISWVEQSTTVVANDGEEDENKPLGEEPAPSWSY